MMRLVPVLCCAVLSSACGGKADPAPDAPEPGSVAGARQPGSGRASAAPGSGRQPNVTELAPPIQETCDDNPLLAGCPFATTPLQPLPEPPQENPPESPVRFVERILDENCGMCHGSQARNDCNASSCAPGMTYIDDLARLVTSGKIVPCNWQGSLVAQRIQDGSMPPAGSGVRAMRPNAQKVVADYIDGICSSLIFDESSAAELQEVKRILGEHCNDCHGFVPASPEGRPDGLVNIQDVFGLIDAGFILACNSSVSPIIQALQEGSAHLASYPMGRPSDDDVRVLTDFIDRPCRR